MERKVPLVYRRTGGSSSFDDRFIQIPHFLKRKSWKVLILTDNFDMFNLKNICFVWEISMFYGTVHFVGGKKGMEWEMHHVQQKVKMFDGKLSVASGNIQSFHEN